VTKDPPESFEKNKLPDEELSETKNRSGINLNIARPIGVIGVILSIVLGYLFFFDFIENPGLINGVMSVMSLFILIFSTQFIMSEKRSVGIDNYLNDFNKTNNFDENEAKDAIKKMRHDIKPDALLKEKLGKAALDRLDKNENIQFFLTGFDLDIDDNDEGHNSQLLVTDKKVVMLATSITGKQSEYIVSYSDIIGLSVQRRITSHIRIQTAGHSYKVSASGSPPELADDVVEYMRKKKDEADATIDDPTKDDPLDKIDRLADLHERNAITTEEFKAQKEQLMEKL